MPDKRTAILIKKCINFYVSNLTHDETMCPSIDEMREIIELDDITKKLDQSNETS